MRTLNIILEEIKQVIPEENQGLINEVNLAVDGIKAKAIANAKTEAEELRVVVEQQSTKLGDIKQAVIDSKQLEIAKEIFGDEFLIGLDLAKPAKDLEDDEEIKKLFTETREADKYKSIFYPTKPGETKAFTKKGGVVVIDNGATLNEKVNAIINKG